jgi:hypothetical protein
MRQALEASRMVSADRRLQEELMRRVLRWAGDMDLGLPPPVMGQRIHRLLRELSGNSDPYREAKKRQNTIAMALLPELERVVGSSSDPLLTAARMAVAGNIIDMGVGGAFDETSVRASIGRAADEPLQGCWDDLRRAVESARRILYLADNAGEIALDRLLVERLGPERLTVAVRGGPAINDATMEDAVDVGLDRVVKVIDNGSDAPGTILEDCSSSFLELFHKADMVIAKGQGNYETLSEAPREVFFLFQAKCTVAALHAGFPIGSRVVTKSNSSYPGRK